LTARNGQLVTVQDEALARCHILHVLETMRYENPMRPEYGLDYELFGAPTAQPGRVQAQLEAHVPNATFSVVERVEDDGVRLDVFWSYNGVSQETITL
jgi:hypothetical protein